MKFKQFSTFIKKLEKDYDIDIEINSELQDSTAYVHFNLIEIGVAEMTTECEFLSAIFHEIGHILNFRRGDFQALHHFHPDNYTQSQVKVILKTALRAEQFTDDVGRLEMQKYHPAKTYIAEYSNPAVIVKYKQFITDFFTPFLK